MDFYKVSVRALVEYVFSSGSIDSRFRSASSLAEGTKAHQKIQKTYSDNDQREVFLGVDIPLDDMIVQIEGRCDGLLEGEERKIIDEIKSTAADLSLIEEESYPVHWAQAKCYAYMYAKAHGQNEMEVQLTYFQIESEEMKKFSKVFSIAELGKFMDEVVEEYRPFAQYQLAHKKKRDDSITSLPFPYQGYRNGQRKLAGAVYKTIVDQKTLMAAAPTGIGKTMSTIFPTIKAIGEKEANRLFYLTAKTITRTAAEEAFLDLEKNGLHMNSVTLTAKDKVCFKEETICQKDYCEFANGYYDRVNGAILDILTHETQMNRSVIERYAQKHKVCPFEFSIDLAYQADAIIGDYNYLFDPRVYLKRLSEEQKSKTVLLVDEAHNLVDRAREMFSAVLLKSPFLQLKKSYKHHNPLFRVLKQINEYFIGVKKECIEEKYKILPGVPDSLLPLLETFIELAEKELLTGGQESEGTELLLETYFSSQNFMRISTFYDEHYMTYSEVSRNEVTLKLFCIDPSANLQKMGKGYRSKVFFSATLSPQHYYQDMLGLEKDDYVITVPSPFNPNQWKVTIQPLSTRYRDRQNSIEPIVKTIGSLAHGKTGNHLIFFPSYQYMEAVYEVFRESFPEVQSIKQETGMTETEREGFLAHFQGGKDQTLLGFAVLGGIFSEGIDLKGDRLNGVAVVGVGLPQIGLERDLIKDFFSGTGKSGYDYSYVYPGMNKVLQAGGRLIRSETDHGTIILIDDRFLQPKYQGLLPEEWRQFDLLKH